MKTVTVPFSDKDVLMIYQSQCISDCNKTYPVPEGYKIFGDTEYGGGNITLECDNEKGYHNTSYLQPISCSSDGNWSRSDSFTGCELWGKCVAFRTLSVTLYLEFFVSFLICNLPQNDMRTNNVDLTCSQTQRGKTAYFDMMYRQKQSYVKMYKFCTKKSFCPYFTCFYLIWI